MKTFQLALVLRAAVVAAAVGGSTLAARADDLFSGRPLYGDGGSPRQQQSPPQQIAPPQETPEQPAPQPPPSNSPPQQADVAMIEAMLTGAGYEVKRVEGGVLVIQVKTDALQIPTVVSLSNDGSQVWVVMVLKTVSSVADMNAGRLIDLMEANQKYGPVFFTFSRETKRIELRRAVRNLGLDAAQLQLQINVMTLVASETVETWSLGTLGGNAPSNNERAETPPQKPNPPAVSREVGRWVVKLNGGENFELTLSADGSFLLVHAKGDGTTETSRGRYTLKQGQLNLEVTGQPALVGRVTFTSDDAFTFVAGDGGGLAFRRA